jgi:hypothetical protein
MRRLALAVIALVVLQGFLDAQVPQPFPRPRDPQTPARPAPTPPPSAPAQTAPAPAPGPEAAQTAASPELPPTEAALGLPLYPNSQFITSYDAGRGQRYYLFGSVASFPELVKYYQSVLKAKGTLVFEAPATHIFEVGKFREETMAFPPGVTIKDYTWSGSAGYLNPKRDGKPDRFPSIIQIVPIPPGAPR